MIGMVDIYVVFVGGVLVVDCGCYSVVFIEVFD